MSYTVVIIQKHAKVHKMFQKLLPFSKTKTEKNSNVPDWVGSNYMARLHYQHYQPHFRYTGPPPP